MLLWPPGCMTTGQQTSGMCWEDLVLMHFPVPMHMVSALAKASLDVFICNACVLPVASTALFKNPHLLLPQRKGAFVPRAVLVCIDFRCPASHMCAGFLWVPSA